MTRRASTPFLLALVAAACLGAGARTAVAANTTKGQGDPGDLKSLNVEQTTGGNPILLRGGDARQQLCVTGVYSTGQSRDLTRAVRYSADPTGIVDIDAKGLVIPLRDGEAHIRVSGPGHTSAEFPVKVDRFAHPLPINFKNQARGGLSANAMPSCLAAADTARSVVHSLKPSISADASRCISTQPRPLPQKRRDSNR